MQNLTTIYPNTENIAQTLEERICGAYRLGRFISASEAGGSRNTCRVFRTRTGQWFVRRRHGGYCDEKRVKFDHATIPFRRRLASNHIAWRWIWPKNRGVIKDVTIRHGHDTDGTDMGQHLIHEKLSEDIVNFSLSVLSVIRGKNTSVNAAI